MGTQIGNDNLSEHARGAVKRIKALRTLTERSGIVTKNEQIQVLLRLDGEEMLQVADACFPNKMINSILGGGK